MILGPRKLIQMIKLHGNKLHITEYTNYSLDDSISLLTYQILDPNFSQVDPNHPSHQLLTPLPKGQSNLINSWFSLAKAAIKQCHGLRCVLQCPAPKPRQWRCTKIDKHWLLLEGGSKNYQKTVKVHGNCTKKVDYKCHWSALWSWGLSTEQSNPDLTE